MTYNERLTQLLCISVEKSNALIDVVSEEGQTNSSAYLKANNEWEAAEAEYMSFLKFLESGQVDPDAGVERGISATYPGHCSYAGFLIS